MESQPPPPSSTPNRAATSPRPPIAPFKIRLMCSYGGHILPRPHDKSLFYAGGETRIVAVERRSIAASISALSAYLSRTLFHNRPFHLKYQLPDEDLDSLISVVTDEDLSNMLEEHDRINLPSRIRLFLFPVKPESVGTALLDPKSESWFCDALKSTRVLQKGQSADCGLLMDIGSDSDAPVESGGGGGGDGKLGAESLVLETSSSFGSTSSLFSMSNSPPIGTANCVEKGADVLDTKNRVPSSTSIESEYGVGNLAAPPKNGILEEPLIQVGPDESSENPIIDPSSDIATQKPVLPLGYPLSQLSNGKKQQNETPVIQGGLCYVHQYAGPMPISPYYPVYQMSMHPQHISCHPNQPYPVYLVPVRQSQYPNMPIPCIDANTTNSSSQPPVNSETAVITQPIVHRDVFGDEIVNTASNQGQLVIGPTEPQIDSEPLTSVSEVSAIQDGEFDEDIAYNPIYKSQPSQPIFPSHFQTTTKGITTLPEPSIYAKQQAPLHTL